VAAATDRLSHQTFRRDSGVASESVAGRQRRSLAKAVRHARAGKLLSIFAEVVAVFASPRGDVVVSPDAHKTWNFVAPGRRGALRALFVSLSFGRGKMADISCSNSLARPFYDWIFGERAIRRGAL